MSIAAVALALVGCTRVFTRASYLACRCPNNQEEQRHPFEFGQPPLQEEPEEDARRCDLQVAEDLVRRRIHVLEEQELDVVLKQVNGGGNDEKRNRLPVLRGRSGGGLKRMRQTSVPWRRYPITRNTQATRNPPL